MEDKLKIQNAYKKYEAEISSQNATLVSVSKTYPVEAIKAVYEVGGRNFGENKVQELTAKYEELKHLEDIKWHQIGVLQSNKVKYIAPFIHCIHSVDSEKLLQEINKQAGKAGRKISCLMQVYIAQEETKQGWEQEELMEFFIPNRYQTYENIEYSGLMGMATFTSNEVQITSEFQGLTKLFQEIQGILREQEYLGSTQFKELSMGMSGDYKIALEAGSTMVRIGSSIFGSRG